MISARTGGIVPSAIREVTDRARPTSLHLGLGQPDLALHPKVHSALLHASGTTAPYGPNLGLLTAREAVANHYGIHPEEVMITSGVQEGLALALLGILEPGDEVLIPDPGFVAYANLVRFAGAVPVPYALGPDWALCLDRITLAASAKTRVIVLNSPSNPTGVVHTPKAITDVVRWCEAQGVRWVSDEIYEDFTYGDTPHLSPAALHPEGGLRLGGLSKSHAMMGWRLGWMTGPAYVIDGLKGLHQHLVTSAVVGPQRVIPVALEVHTEHMMDMRATFVHRRDVLFSGLRQVWPKMPEWKSDGAFYAMLDVRTQAQNVGGTHLLALRILDEIDVVTIPGSGFGTGGDGYLRLAYTVNEVVLREAAQRLGGLLARL